VPADLYVFPKAIIFSPHDEGRRLVDFVHINQRRTPGLWKAAAKRDYSPEVHGMVQDLKPEPGFVYPLINALGAGEFWSSNSNADYFAEDQLNPADGTDKYGHKTFRKYARPYKHHINKPDSPAYGEVLGNVYNPRMHRVELLAKIAKVLAPDIAEKIDEGEDVPVSMGCKVPYDVCSICGNQAKNTEEYCDCMKYTPNKTLDDGRKVFVFNIRPRFFDISFVFVGADPTARVLDKVASARTITNAWPLTPHAVRFPSGLWAYKMGYHAKSAEIDKDAEIEKRVQGTATDALKAKANEIDQGVKELSKYEESLQPQDLAKAAALAPRDSIVEPLATFSQAGIVLNPREFQYLALCKMGMKTAADKAWELGVTFQEDQADSDQIYKHSHYMFDFGVERTCPEISKIAARYLEKRSAFSPFLGQRAEKAVDDAPLPPGVQAGRIPPDVGAEFAPFLGSLAAMYAAYRDKIPNSKMGLLDKLVAKNPALLALLAGVTAGGVMGINKLLSTGDYTKQGSSKTAVLGSPLSRVLGIPALAYLYSGHQQRKRWRGEDLGPVDTLMADYPWLGALGGIGLAQKIVSSPLVGKIASVVSNARHDTLRSCGDRSLMDYKATLDLTKLASRRLGGTDAGQLGTKGKA